MKKYIPKPGVPNPTPAPSVSAPKQRKTKEVYDPKKRTTYIIDVKTGKSIAQSVPGPKFRPGVKKGGR